MVIKLETDRQTDKVIHRVAWQVTKKMSLLISWYSIFCFNQDTAGFVTQWMESCDGEVASVNLCKKISSSRLQEIKATCGAMNTDPVFALCKQVRTLHMTISL